MDGILVQDSDWSIKLSSSLASLLQKKQLCDLGIVCGVQNDVTNLKSNEVVMVHRCILAGASETIRKLSIGGQVYNLVKINGIDISAACWDNVLDFVYKSKTNVLGYNLCDVKKAAQVLQIKPLETAVDLHHAGLTKCKCNRKNDELLGNVQAEDSEILSRTFDVFDSNWLTVLFEGMLDLLVKQSLCNMTIITEKQDKVSAEILAHLCMLVASSATIKELVFQGTETYNSVKIDSISYNTWLYLLEYIYTSRVSIVKSNIPEVWVASQLLQIDGLANAVAPFASQMGATVSTHGPLRNLKKEENQVKSSLIRVKKELLFDEKSLSVDSPSTSGSSVKQEKALDEILVNKSSTLDDPDTSNDSHLPSLPSVGSEKSTSGVSVPSSGILHEDSRSSLGGASLNDAVVAQIPSPLLNVNIGLPGGVLTPVQGVSQQLVLPGSGTLPTLVAGIPGNGQGQLVNAVQSDGTSAMLWLPANQILPIVSSPQVAENNTISPGSKAGVTSIIATTTQEAEQLEESSTLQAQQQNSEAEGNSLILCNICSKVNVDQTQLEKHLYEEHGVLTSSPPKQENSASDINKLKCKFCKKVFSRTWTLNVHLRTHTGERPYRCKTCGKAFSDKSNMRQHSLIHTSKKEYHCPKCNQAFAQKRYMKKHYIETCLRKTAPASLPKTNGQPHYIIAYIGENQSDSNSVTVPDTSHKNQTNTPELVSPISAVGVECDIDLVDEEPLQKDLPPGSESSAAWDTSIIITPTQDNDEDLEEHQGHIEEDESSDYADLALTREDSLYCGNCKKHFKTARQRNSHRCMDF